MKLLKKAVGALFVIVLGVLLAFNIGMIANRAITGNPQPTVFGYSSAVVVSGSMSGTIEVDDMIISHRQMNYKVGDIVLYRTDNSCITHRIVEESPNGFITQGDNNNTPDADPVPVKRIVGKVVFIIPKIGAFVHFVKTPLGMSALILVGLLFFEIPYLTRKFREGGEKNEKT